MKAAINHMQIFVFKQKKKHQKLEEEGSERSEEPGNNDSDDSIQSDDGDVSGDEEDNASRDKQKTPIVSGNVKSNLSTQINKDPSLYKPPSNEELNQLKETENLFHSSLFRMQVCLNLFFFKAIHVHKKM